jgi:hypothetical protein
MDVVACGTGFNKVSVEEICLARGINIVAYIEPTPQTTCPPKSESKLKPAVYNFLRTAYSKLGPTSQRLGMRIAGSLGLLGMIGGPPIPDGYLFPERLEGKNVISPEQAHDYEFDYVLIGHPNYERFRFELTRRGIRSSKIVSVWNAENKYLNKLGEEKFFLCRKKKMVEGIPRRYYELLALGGVVTEDVPSPVPLEAQYPLVDKLLQSCRLALEAIRRAPIGYRPGFNWELFLKDTRGDLWDLIEKHKVSELTALLNSCLRNRLTEGMYGGATAFSDWKDTPYSISVERMKGCYNSWAYTINEEPNLAELGLPPIGNPCVLRLAGAIVNANCFYNHYRAVFASRLLDNLERPVVAEIGGGVGLLGYYLQKRNKTAVYIDFDLPENLLVESYFLSMAFPEKKVLLYEGDGTRIDSDTLSNYDIVLMPNFMLPKLSDLSVDLFSNTISLSEMDYETISEYMAQIERTCRRYFYHENLADFNFAYKNYPADFFPIPKVFHEIMTSASRWPHFAMTSKEHMYVETLYERR